MEMQVKHYSDHRVFRAAILNGVNPPPATVARLEALGVNIHELERRIRQQIMWRH